MASLLSDAISGVLRPAVKALAGAEVVYISGVTGQRYTVVATFDNSVGEAETEEGVQFSMNLKDFKIEVLDLPVVPQRLDSIEWTDDNGITKYYRVLSDGSERAVEPQGNFGHAYLIHTKEEPAPAALDAHYGNQGGFGYANKDGVGYGSARR